MKAKFFKLLLPAFAILMAVGLAFATENENVVQEAYYFLPGVGWQTVMVEENCSDEGKLCPVKLMEINCIHNQISEVLPCAKLISFTFHEPKGALNRAPFLTNSNISHASVLVYFAKGKLFCSREDSVDFLKA